MRGEACVKILLLAGSVPASSLKRSSWSGGGCVVFSGDMREPEAAVVILRTRGPDSRILLMRRAEREGDSWSGHWSLPGGRKESSDRDLLETAVRELREECGIGLSPEQVGEALPLAIARRRTGPFLLVAPYVFEIDNELPTVLDAREAVGAMWIPQRTLTDPTQHSFQRVPGMPAEVRFPGITLPGAPLWGFTYHLLVDWLKIRPGECAASGFELAGNVLSFLLSRGLTLKRGWGSRGTGDGEGSGPVQVAEVSGPIPVDAVVERFSPAGLFVASVHRFEARPELIRIHGLGFEEYLIESSHA